MGDSRLAPLVLSEDERRTLENWVRRRSTAQGLALRARIVLACAAGGSNTAVAARLGVNFKTVSGWRARFLRDRLDGLTDDPRPGVPRTITDAQVEEVVVRTLERLRASSFPSSGSASATSSRGSRPGSRVIARKTSATVTSRPGRCTISTGSAARIPPGSITRRYAPGSAACVNRLIQPSRSSQPWKVAHGIRARHLENDVRADPPALTDQGAADV
jgi:hypothetical protein